MRVAHFAVAGVALRRPAMQKIPVLCFSKQEVAARRVDGCALTSSRIRFDSVTYIVLLARWVVCLWGAIPATVGRGPARVGKEEGSCPKVP